MELEGGRRDYVRKPEAEGNARRAQASEQKPGRAERGQPSNVFCYKGSTYLLYAVEHLRRVGVAPAKIAIVAAIRCSRMHA